MASNLSGGGWVGGDPNDTTKKALVQLIVHLTSETFSGIQKRASEENLNMQLMDEKIILQVSTSERWL